MHRYGVTGESVEDQHVESLRISISQFALHSQPRVARHDLDPRARIPQIGKVPAFISDFSNGWINFVEADVVAGQPIRGNRSYAEANRANTERTVARIARESARMIEQDQSDSAVPTVVGSRLASLIGSRILLAMYDLTMPQHVVVAFGVLTID